MPTAVPTLSLHVEAARLPEVLMKIATYLVQQRYAFLQTVQRAPGATVTIFTQEGQPVLQLLLHAGSSLEPSPADLVLSRALSRTCHRLQQDLMRICTSR